MCDHPDICSETWERRMLHVPQTDFIHLARDALSHALNIAYHAPPPARPPPLTGFLLPYA